VILTKFSGTAKTVQSDPRVLAQSPQSWKPWGKAQVGEQGVGRNLVV
jgi:hypothetical protein